MAKKNYMKELLEQYGRLDRSYRNSFNQGDIVQHFKREITNTVNSPNEYLYKILCIAKHTEKDEYIDMSDGLFIDDSAKNLITSNAKENICFGEIYSWNKEWTGKRMNNWYEIQQYLLEERMEI